MIDHDTIRRILDTADIVEVIGDFVKLKKSGSSYKGLSPFSSEKTPSFYVVPSKGIFKDFSSGKGGNVLTFLMEHERITYPEAIRYLARKYHIEIVEEQETAEDIRKRNERDSLFIITTHAEKYFSYVLNNTEEGRAIGKSYLRERGMRDDIIHRFGLGFSPEQRDAYTREALKQGYKLEYLLTSGLTLGRDNNHYDRFHGRVMFPIHNLSGKIVGFGGRTLKTEKSVPKYLNSPESEIYSKSRELYGLFFAKNEIVKQNKCFLVEGYTDVISMHQAGVENVVASSGTALTKEQVRLIKRFTENITILYDGDPAGIRASLRGIDLVLEEGMNVKIVLLPDGDDPDSFSKKHTPDEFTRFIGQNEKDFIQFKTELLVADALHDPVKKAGLVNEIVRSIAAIPDNITRTVYLRECSRMLDMDEAVLVAETARLRREHRELERKHTHSTSRPVVNEAPPPGLPPDMEVLQTEAPVADIPVSLAVDEAELIRLLITYAPAELFRTGEGPEETTVSVARFVFDEIENDELHLSHPVLQRIYILAKNLFESGEPIDERFFTQHPDPEVCRIAVDLLTPRYELSRIWAKRDAHVETEEMNLRQIITETIISFKSRNLQRFFTDTQKEIRIAQNEQDNSRLMQLLERTVALNNIRKDISREVNNRIII